MKNLSMAEKLFFVPGEVFDVNSSLLCGCSE
jgi:hypothetical protein